MKRRIVSRVGLLLLPLAILAGCGDDPVSTVDTVPPLAPQVTGATFEGGMVGVWWEPNTEPDLAGYNVYVIEDGVSRQASENSGQDNYVVFYSDTRMVQVYVTAIDFTGNESSPSRTLRATNENLHDARDTANDRPLEL